jgi:hypothetical protein
MFTMKTKTDNSVLITSNEMELIFPVNSFKRAQGRKEGNGNIRKPVEVEIDGNPVVFTRKEWADGKKNALEYHKDIQQVRRQEILDKVMLSKRLSKQRALWLKLEADAEGSRN